MHKVLFLYLKAFSFTGGIEKFNRNFLKALHEWSVDGVIQAEAYSMYDTETDRRYFPKKRFKGFGGKRLQFVGNALIEASDFQTIILGHINLAVVGVLIKAFCPKVQIVLIAHGIEVWQPQKGMKKTLLTKVNSVYCVSHYTREQLLKHHVFLQPAQCRLFPNTLDAYFTLPMLGAKPADLLQHYQIKPETKVLLTVTRLQSSEKYKGYDTVVRLMPALLQMNPHIRYYIIGKADVAEAKRMQQLIETLHLQQHVFLLGFVPDALLQQHYLMADVFIMPSQKEGFGIVFIEAMACGLPVIAGNKDGSRDALLNGRLGTLVDPSDPAAILQALQQILLHPPDMKGELLQQEVWKHFSFTAYKWRLQQLLAGVERVQLDESTPEN